MSKEPRVVRPAGEARPGPARPGLEGGRLLHLDAGSPGALEVPARPVAADEPPPRAERDRDQVLDVLRPDEVAHDPTVVEVADEQARHPLEHGSRTAGHGALRAAIRAGGDRLGILLAH